MPGQTIVTNLRMDVADWLQTKALAAEMGMSVNEYVNYLIRSLSIKRELAIDLAKRGRIAHTIWDLAEMARAFHRQGKKLSPDDKIIYGR